jgi:aminopeptidase YwaD
MRKIAIFLFLHIISFSLFSQNIEYARKIIDTLTSEYFYGRGAVNDGEKKAADYLVNEFKRKGLKPLNNSFLQKFNYPINTFPGKMEVRLDNLQLVAGKDFIVMPNSSGVNGTFKIVWYTDDNVPTKKELKKLLNVNFFQNKFIVIDSEDKENESFSMFRLNLVGAVGIINIEEKKLTQSLSSTYNDYAALVIKRESISRYNKTIEVVIQQKFIRDYQSQNVIGYLEGTEYPDSFILLCAHYDHLGVMGSEVYFPGANDNASGVALLLNLADHYAHKEPPTKTIVFVAFGAEEAGLVGSKFFVDHPKVSLYKINFVFNMDLMGTGSEGATIVNGTIFPNQFQKLQNINQKNEYLPIIKKRGKAANSDHYWFSEKGVPAFFIYLAGGIKAYHDIEDVSKTLPLTKFKNSFRLIRDFVDEL